MRRVLKPGGVAGIRCIDLGGTLFWPDPEGTLAHGNTLWARYRTSAGGDPHMGRKLRGLLREAGFARTEGSAGGEAWATPERIETFLPALIEEFTGPRIAAAARKHGWADDAEMAAIRQALETWARAPDAYMSIAWGEVVGWRVAKPSETSRS